MAFNVTFYQFSKRENSTKIPAASAGTVYSCTLKDGCSVISPTIEIHYTGSGNPAAFNYAYIADFSRYYFIGDWEYNRGIWTADLSVDVLASYKTQIGASSRYVLRSASSYDGSIVDNMATKLPEKVKIQPVSSPFTDLSNYQSGWYIIGLQGASPSSQVPMVGGVNYYPLSYTQMMEFTNYLQSSTLAALMADTSAGLTAEVAKILQDPAQYIVSLMWLPLNAIGTSYASNIQPKLGWWDTAPLTTPTIGLGQGMPALIREYDIEVSLPVHPQLASGNYGKYLKAAPYSRYAFVMDPWGEIPLDGASLIDSDTLRAHILLDLMTGVATLTIRDVTSGSPNNGKVLARQSAQVGVSMSISQMIYDLSKVDEGLKSAAVATVAKAAENSTATISSAIEQVKSKSLWQNIKDGFRKIFGTAEIAQRKKAISNAASNIGANIQEIASSGLAVMATPELKGVSGSFLNYYEGSRSYTEDGLTYTYKEQGPYIRLTYLDAVDPNNDENGRPLMQIRTLNTLSGYIQCAEGDIAIAAFNEEIEAIAQCLVGGFFYE